MQEKLWKLSMTVGFVMFQTGVIPIPLSSPAYWHSNQKPAALQMMERANHIYRCTKSPIHRA